ncbi:hypothetical protein BJ964_006167 [Actinoplanes lobatus]|uniref:Uncharacterized protein n=1 Tax=Actinoplanes lobatus TaxID=113568 RepID=A0A7W7HK50_9ACTN|nr:hypothetical protein [Actinoplanes lobatus]
MSSRLPHGSATERALRRVTAGARAPTSVMPMCGCFGYHFGCAAIVLELLPPNGQELKVAC